MKFDRYLYSRKFGVRNLLSIRFSLSTAHQFCPRANLDVIGIQAIFEFVNVSLQSLAAEYQSRRSRRALNSPSAQIQAYWK